MIKLRGIGKPIQLATKYLGGNRYCAICGSNVAAWIPHSLALRQPPLMKHLKVVGSDLLNYACPVCACFDRERHLALYLKATNFLAEHVTGKRVLHFAAEKPISELILASQPQKYVKANLYPNASDIEKIDMQAISYGDQNFDLVVANHVLEHVSDDHLALSEIRRVLAVGGFAILQTPFSAQLDKTFEDPGLDNDYLRTALCGQADHLRLYGRDIFERVAAHGFVPRTAQHAELLRGIDPRKYGVPHNEPFMLFERAQS